MHRLALCLALLTASAALAGCLGDTGNEVFGCEPPKITTFTPPTTDGGIAHAPGEPIPLLLWIENPGAVEYKVDLTIEPAATLVDGDQEADPLPSEITLNDGDAFFFPLNVEVPDDGGSIELGIVGDGSSDLESLPCESAFVEETTFEVAPAEEAERGEGGKGVLVRTVGVWERGPSFYTNMERYHEHPDTPAEYLGPYNGSDPLPVYVYNETSDERPERYNDSGYYTTIEGFNAALHGIPTVGGRLTYVHAEEGYTTQGNEDHPLYGDNLIFYTEALEVETVPCEVPQPICMPPDEGDLPPPPAQLSPVTLS